MYECAYDLNEAPYLENVGQIMYQYNGFYYDIMGSIQEPPFNKSIPPYIIVCKQDQQKVDLDTSDIKICRLCMNKPEYLDSEYDTDKYKLNDGEIDCVLLNLNKKYYCRALNNRLFNRFWDYLLYEYNRYYEINISNYINIPDYAALYERERYGKNK